MKELINGHDTKKQITVRQRTDPRARHVPPMFSKLEYDSRQGEPGPTKIRRSWVDRCTDLEREKKKLLARYLSNHHVQYGFGIMVGSGTTPELFVENLFEFQDENDEPLDLKICSTNQGLVRKVSAAVAERPEIFLNTQVSATGGIILPALDSLVGDFAVLSIESDLLFPDLTVLGCASITFREGLRIGYQFQQELSVQKALAARGSRHKVVLFDHTKFGASGWRADITLDTLLFGTPKCTLLTTYPDDAKAQKRVEEEIDAFRMIIEDLASQYQSGQLESCSDLVLLAIASDGRVKHEISLSKRLEGLVAADDTSIEANANENRS